MTRNQALEEILRIMRKYGLTLEEIQGQDPELTTLGTAGVVSRLAGRPA